MKLDILNKRFILIQYEQFFVRVLQVTAVSPIQRAYICTQPTRHGNNPVLMNTRQSFSSRARDKLRTACGTFLLLEELYSCHVKILVH